MPMMPCLIDVFNVRSTAPSIVNLWRALRPEDSYVYWGAKIHRDWTKYLESFVTRTLLFALVGRGIRQETENIFDVELAVP
jgi:hypothetical protein